MYRRLMSHNAIPALSYRMFIFRELVGELAGEAGLDQLRDREAAAAAAACTAGAATQEHGDTVADDTHLHLDERRRCRGELELHPFA